MVTPRRRLTLAQLRALIDALRTRRSAAAPGLDLLWNKVLEQAMLRERRVQEALVAAKGKPGR
jgi:hypothetical protein